MGMREYAMFPAAPVMQRVILFDSIGSLSEFGSV
eukprot:CAMPEP_0114585964 /NCGR_PEP_ID=MMETSP0125-20121206/9339_1 /TAXON_ID=485358 ORGANISM="Aristerostoma sp., Strain ATCC 50986" /NCGR_SAMPLE_ID=MMETSP0125 /ASSEMBLY_ACC=CAM_ASM_000245 /LENGTH=33 /DNA_ID= /DNA_START= /DNA_END= /DNA_ORIENTATION=